MKSAGRSMPSASSVIGSVEVLEHSSASSLTYGATSAKTLALSAGSSKTASMTRSQPARSAGSAVGGDPAEQLVGLVLGDLAALDALGVELGGVGLALLGVLGRDVLEHDLHARAGARVGDAGAHHPGAEDADLGGLPALDALGAQRPGVDRLQVEEERLDHVLGALVDDQAGEVARLDPRRGVEVDLRALDRGAEDRPRRGVDGALGLLAQQRREGRAGTAPGPGSSACRRASCSRRGPTAGWPPPRRRGARGSTPSRPARSSSRVGSSSSTRPLASAPCGSNWVPGMQHVHQRGLQAEHAYDARDAAAAGQQAEGGLGQADLDRAVVDGDAVVGGQRDLEATAERGAVDRGDDRDAGSARGGAGRP